MSLLVVGTVAYDSIETPHGKHDNVLGGSACYFAVAASQFTRVRLVAPVGDDFAHESALKDRNIDTTCLQRTPGGKTFRWSGQYREAMNEAVTLRTDLNVLATFSPRIPEALLDSDYVFLANIDPVIQLDIVNRFPSARLIACDTMNYWIERTREELLRVVKRVGALIINEAEARSLTRETNILRAIRAIHSLGPRAVVIKRGEYGALSSLDGELFAIPGLPLDTVKDPTGAGDSFAGGFMGYLAGSSTDLDAESLRKAVLYGSMLASFAVEDFGLGRLLSLTPDDMEHRSKAFLDLVRVHA